MIPIVIPLHHGGGKLKDDSELRFALRSIERHFKEPFEIVIVGRKLPDWLTGVRHIHAKGLKSSLVAAANAYPGGFFWTYDDLCLLQDLTAAQMKVTPACRSWRSARTNWARKLDAIRKRLEKEGHVPRDYSRPHGPYWFDKSMVDEGFKDWPGMANKFPWESWILSKRKWPCCHGVVKQYYGPFRGEPAEKMRYLNYCDAGFTPALRKWLGERFSTPSRFERKEEPEEDCEVSGVVLRLPRSPRWEHECVEACENVRIRLEYFDGVDAHNGEEVPVPLDLAAFKKNCGRSAFPGEIGCFASHVMIARRAPELPPLHESVPEWRLVLEDDVLPEGLTGEKIAYLAKQAERQGFDFVQLHTGKKAKRSRRGSSMRLTAGRDAGTYAYIARLSALEKIRDWVMVRPIDTSLRRSKSITMGLLWGSARFVHRDPFSSSVSIHRERHGKVVASGRPSPAFETLRFFSGKRVAIVGNAPHALSNTEPIDDYDAVVRFNRFQTGHGFEAVGTRTDVLALPVACSEVLTNAMTKHRHEMVLDFSLRRDKDFTTKLERFKQLVDAPRIEVPESFHTVLANELGPVRPTTGLATIAWLLEHGELAEIYLTGFSFEVAKRDHYFDDPLGYGYHNHCPIKELHWLARNASRGPFKFDDHIKRKLFEGQPCDEVAEHERRKGRPYSDVHRSIYQTIAPKVSGMKVLEVGAGIGWGAAMMTEGGAAVTLIEPHPRAASFLQNQGWKVLPDFPTEAALFDAVTCVEVIEHLAASEVHKFLTEMRRHAPRLFLSTPDRKISTHGRRTKLEWEWALSLAGWRVCVATPRGWSIYIEAEAI